MSLARPIRALMVVAVAVLALPAVAAAKGPAALGAHVLAVGTDAGRVAVRADVVHPADALRRTDTVRIDVSRGGSALATGTDRMPRSRTKAVTASHQVVLGAAESRRVRTAARGGHRLRLTVTSTPGDGGAAQVATATVALGVSSLPPLAGCYQNPESNAFVYVVRDAVTEVSLDNDVATWWRPDAGPAAVTPTQPGGPAMWSAPGTMFASSALTDPVATSTFSGFFAVDGQSGSLILGPVDPSAGMPIAPCAP
jgi:hypothetical protein